MRHLARIAVLSAPLFAAGVAQADDFAFSHVTLAQGARTAFFMSHYPDSKTPFYFATKCADVLQLGVERLSLHYMVHFGDAPVMKPIVLEAVTEARKNCLGPTS